MKFPTIITRRGAFSLPFTYLKMVISAETIKKLRPYRRVERMTPVEPFL